jgi:hypothetical protein
LFSGVCLFVAFTNKQVFIIFYKINQQDAPVFQVYYLASWSGRIVCPTTTNNVTSFNLQRMQNQRLRVQLYAPDNGRYDAGNMLSHK